jgi:hypothetical protein
VKLNPKAPHGSFSKVLVSNDQTLTPAAALKTPLIMFVLAMLPSEFSHQEYSIGKKITA